MVNSQHGTSLRLTAELSEWKAAQTKDPKDIEAAQQATLAWKEHEREQAKVDAGKVPPPGDIKSVVQAITDIKTGIDELKAAGTPAPAPTPNVVVTPNPAASGKQDVHIDAQNVTVTPAREKE